MALSASDFSGQKRQFVSPGMMRVVGTYTGPASYAAGGEILTQAIAHAAFMGMNTILRLDFTPLYDTTNSKTAGIAFDHNRSGTTMGKIHISSGGEGAHTHPVLIKGGQGAGVALQIDVDSAAGVIGKTAATDRVLTSTDGVKNIQANTAAVSSADSAAATPYNTFTCRFIVEGA